MAMQPTFPLSADIRVNALCMCDGCLPATLGFAEACRNFRNVDGTPPAGACG